MSINKHILRLTALFAIAIMLFSVSSLGTTPAFGQDDATPEAQSLDIPEKIDASGKPLDVIKRLRKLDLIPDGGDVLLKPISAGSFSRQKGLQRNTYFFLGDPNQQADSSTVTNFVAHTEIVALNLVNEGDSCGLIVRVKDRTSQATAFMLTAGESFLIVEANGKKTGVSDEVKISDLDNFDPKYSLGPNTRTGLTIIAVDESLTFYVNNYLVYHSENFKPVEGDIYMAVQGEEDVTKARICNYRNTWVWGLDS